MRIIRLHISACCYPAFPATPRIDMEQFTVILPRFGAYKVLVPSASVSQTQHRQASLICPFLLLVFYFPHSENSQAGPGFLLVFYRLIKQQSLCANTVFPGPHRAIDHSHNKPCRASRSHCTYTPICLRPPPPHITLESNHQSWVLQLLLLEKQRQQRTRCTDGREQVNFDPAFNPRFVHVQKLTPYLQVVSPVACVARSAMKASPVAEHANISVWHASTSGQCGGAMESRGDRTRRRSRISSRRHRSPKRRMHRHLLRICLTLHRPLTPARTRNHNLALPQSRQPRILQNAPFSRKGTLLFLPWTRQCRTHNIQCSRRTKSISRLNDKSLSMISPQEEIPPSRHLVPSNLRSC